jgi:hypothetical protein
MRKLLIVSGGLLLLVARQNQKEKTVSPRSENRRCSWKQRSDAVLALATSLLLCHSNQQKTQTL